MRRIFTLLSVCAFAFAVKAQDAVQTPVYEPYGKVSQKDLEMTACDFEKDANAEVLIDKGDLYFDQKLGISMECHKRIKIFNDNGKNHANIRLEFISNNSYEYVTGLQAETINLVDGKAQITKLDKSLIYKQNIDKYRTALVFSMPNVKAGSIIEYKYVWNTQAFYNMPKWYFQADIPVRYSELITAIPEYFYFSTQTGTMFPYTKRAQSRGNGAIVVDNQSITYTTNIEDRVITNIPSLADEPFMSSRNDNLQSLTFHLTTFTPPYGFVEQYSDSWAKVGGILADNEDFGGQLKRKLTNEEAIITKAKGLKTDDEKISYIFNEVKNSMKWNGNDDWYTNDGTCKAWDNKTGNSTEINLILYHLLKKSGVVALPMVVSTREHGKVNPAYSFLYQFNRAVVYIPVDSTKLYILDATNKYNTVNEIPFNLLNSYGLYVNMDAKTYDIVFLDKREPVRKAVYIDAQIMPEGKLSGTAVISNFSYNRINNITRYKTDGETKYLDYLRDNDNNLKISSLKQDNLEVDSLPLIQYVSFNLDLSGTDENYIYFNPNLFTLLHKNPFLSDKRTTNIDFGYPDNLSLNGVYKLPAGYKIDVLPKNISMTTPDNNISFKRIIGQQDGAIAVRYSISYRKSVYMKDSYNDYHEFFKMMYEMLNEQIVLKKG